MGTLGATTSTTDLPGLAGGTDVAVADGGTGASTAANAATALGVGTGNSPQFTGIELGHATDTTLTRVSAGVVAVEGAQVDTWTTIVKASDESVASSTALQADDELKFTAASGGIYEVEIVMIYVSPAGGATPDIKFIFGEDGTVRSAVFASGLGTGDSAFLSAFASVNNNALGGGTAATNRVIVIRSGYVGAGGTAGLYWAQNTSGTDATTVKAGSVLRYRRIL